MSGSVAFCMGVPDGAGWSADDMKAENQSPVMASDTDERARIRDEVRIAATWLGVSEPSCYLNPNKSTSAGPAGININLGQLYDVRAGDDRPNVARMYERFSVTKPDEFERKRTESEMATLRQAIAHEVAHVAQANRYGWSTMAASRILYELQADILANLYLMVGPSRMTGEATVNSMMGNQRVLGCEPGRESTHPDHIKRVQAGLAAITLVGWLNRSGATIDQMRDFLFEATLDIACSIDIDPGAASNKSAEWGQKLVGGSVEGQAHV